MLSFVISNHILILLEGVWASIFPLKIILKILIILSYNTFLAFTLQSNAFLVPKKKGLGLL